MVNFWKLTYKKVKEQRDELQLQNIGLKKELNYRNKSYTELFEVYEKLEQIRDFKDSALKGAGIKIKTLERENEELRSRLDEFLEHDYDNQKLYEEMKRGNRELKDKIEGLKR